MVLLLIAIEIGPEVSLLLASKKAVLGYARNISAWIEVNLNSCQTARAEGQRYAIWPNCRKAYLRYFTRNATLRTYIVFALIYCCCVRLLVYNVDCDANGGCDRVFELNLNCLPMWSRFNYHGYDFDATKSQPVKFFFYVCFHKCFEQNGLCW